MEVAGSAVGIASLGIQVCQGVLSYYSTWKGYSDDIDASHNSILDVIRTFTLLQDSLRSPHLETERVGRAKECLAACVDGIQHLQAKLRELRKFEQPSSKREKLWAGVQKAAYPFRVEAFEKVKKTLEDLQQRLAGAVNVLGLDLTIGLHDHLDGLHDQYQEVTTQAIDLQRSVARLHLSVSAVHGDQSYDRLIRWINAPDPFFNHNAAPRRHEPMTGQWLLESDEYKQWKALPAAQLCLYGKAGCGKTILCSTIIEDIQYYCGNVLDAKHAFFYCSFSDTQKQSHEGLVSSLAVQLLCTGQPLNLLQRAYDDRKSGKPPVDLLEEVLILCIQQYREVYIILDAYDELPDTEEGREAVLAWLGEIVQITPNLKLFITSRQTPDIERNMASFDATVLTVSTDQANRDIGLYVEMELEKISRLRELGGDIKATVKETFERQADGMFRWAYCQLDVLKRLKVRRPAYIEQILRSLPKTLDETYDRMLSSIDEMFHKEVQKALRWLAFSLRPLTLEELAEASVVDPDACSVDKRGPILDTLELLAGLVSVETSREDVSHNASPAASPDTAIGLTRVGSAPDESIGPHSIVRLAHFLVKEYLISSRIFVGPCAVFALQDSVTQHFLAQSCITYLLHYSSDPHKTLSEPDVEAFPLLRYTAELWPTHLNLGNHEGSGYEVQLLLNDVARSDWLLVNQPWLQRWNKLNSSGSGLYHACAMSLQHTAKRMIERGMDVHPKGHTDVPLAAAARNGLDEIVKLLLIAGANIDHEERGIASSHTALRVAVQNRRESTVVILLDAGADPNHGKDARPSDETALFDATIKGFQRIFDMLMRAGAEPTLRDLQTACFFGRYDMAKALLDAGVDVRPQTGWQGIALHHAALGGYISIVEMLIRAGVDVNAMHQYMGTALHCAAKGGHERVVEMLIHEGAVVDAVSSFPMAQMDDDECTALQVAARFEHEAVVDIFENWGYAMSGADFDAIL